MIQLTLLVMAAGLGSRFGGDKQIAKLGPSGETLLEYAVHDAWKAGFSKLVLVTRPELATHLKKELLPHLPKAMEVQLAFQELDKLPAGQRAPEGRRKPWGTAHAALMAAPFIREPFGLINADDFYGTAAIEQLADFLKTNSQADTHALVAYTLKQTLSAFGGVSRGICEAYPEGEAAPSQAPRAASAMDESQSLAKGESSPKQKPAACQNRLKAITEYKEIAINPEGSLQGRDTEGRLRTLSPEAQVSMNLWGLKPSAFGLLQTHFENFLNGCGDKLRGECLLADAFTSPLKSGAIEIKMLPTRSKWHGITFAEELEAVRAMLMEAHKRGDYPSCLRSNP